MTTTKDPIARMEELVTEMNELAEASPALSTTALLTLSLCMQKLLTNTKQHSAESMKDLLLAEEQYEANQNKRAEDLRELKEARKVELIAHKKAKGEADEASNERTVEVCKENARAIAVSQGFDEEFWDNNKPGRVQPMASLAKTRTAAEVVSGFTQASPDMTKVL
ncbi:hypothetical protein GGI13_000563 [Coemansia sp. RSA 455]|nr:hypothetical protein GGI13_000563 [Coemansia sp. RSA 455]